MSLLEDLKEKRSACLHYIEGRKAQISGHEAALADLGAHLADLDIAIAALEPQPPTTPREMTIDGGSISLDRSPETGHPNAPEGPSDATKAAFGICTCNPIDAPFECQRLYSVSACRLAYHDSMAGDDGESADIATLTVAEPTRLEAFKERFQGFIKADNWFDLQSLPDDDEPTPAPEASEKAVA